MDVNEATVRLTGQARSALIGSLFKIHFFDPMKAQEGVRRAYAEGSVRRYELDLLDQHGRRIPVSFNASQYLDAHGQIAGVIAIARTSD
jgi:PAS domain S-box-containing protein